MKKFILVFILSSNFIFSQAETSQNQIDELINGIAKLISKNNSIKSEKFYYKEVLNVTDIVNSSSNARFYGGKTRAGFKLNLPAGTTEWFYRITLMDKDVNFNYPSDQSLSNLLKINAPLSVYNQTNYGIDCFILDDFNIKNFLQTGNDNFSSYSDYIKYNTRGFINFSKLIKNNLWIGVRNPNVMHGLKIIVEVVAFGNFH